MELEIVLVNVSRIKFDLFSIELGSGCFLFYLV